MRTILKTILAILARLTLARYKPRIVGITGSVGKTLTKEAIGLVLASKFKMRCSLENYNNELGLPLSIIGEHSGGKNILIWVLVIIKALLKLFRSDYPEVLILEMGTDRPGDIEYLLGIAGKLDVAVLTDIGVSHLEFFSNPANLAKEKLSIFKGISKQGSALANFDNERIREGLGNVKDRIISYGFDPNSSLYVTDLHLSRRDGTWGVNFKVHHEGTVVPFFLRHALGKPAVYACLAAAGAGLHFEMNLVQISESLKDFSPPVGRLRLIAGIKNTQILDDTYNAAPNSMIAALETLAAISSGRRIVALGDMEELGRASEAGHREVGQKIVELGVNAVFLVGKKVSVIKDELTKRKFSGAVFSSTTADEARIPIQNYLLPNDTILVKGSQSMRMERIVKEIMADPESAGKLLVRQSERWLEKP